MYLSGTIDADRPPINSFLDKVTGDPARMLKGTESGVPTSPHASSSRANFPVFQEQWSTITDTLGEHRPAGRPGCPGQPQPQPHLPSPLPPSRYFRRVSRHVLTCTCLRRTWREALSCSVWIDSHIYMFRLGLISRRREQQKVWKYKYTI